MNEKQVLIERVRENVPEVLRELPVWLLHGAGKTPIYVNGENRCGELDTPADRRNFVRFETAAEALQRVHRASGLGVALGEVPGEEFRLSGIDLDHCFQGGKLDERAVEVLCAADSYAEKSPSGEGLHILGTGDIGTLRTPGLELYSGARFFTVTGVRVNGAHISDITEGAAFARKRYCAPEQNGAGDRAPAPTCPTDSDNQIVIALKAAGLYLRDGGNGKHLVRCPWEARHSPNEAGDRNTSSTEAAYFAPGAIVRNERLDHGMYKCLHAHCDDRHLKHLREFLGIARADGTNGDATPARKLTGVNFADMRPHLSDGYIVKGLLGSNSLTGIIGPPSSGKTFLATDLALHIAAGRTWRGHRVRGGLVIYAALEGPVSAENRFVASRMGRDFPAGTPLRLTPGPINLRDPADVAVLTDFARESEAHFGQKTVAVFVDTLARALAGGDENGPEDMGALIRGADAVRLAIGCTVFLVHHLGKDESRGARGHSSLKAALDTEIVISAREAATIEQVRVACVTKQRDLPAGAKYAFRLKAVEHGRDTDGDVVTSCTVESVDEVPSDRKQPTGKHQRTLLTALLEWKRQHPDTPIISTIEFRSIAKAQRIDRRRLQDATETLEKYGWLIPAIGGYGFLSQEQA
jgi:hypothetical protein